MLSFICRVPVGRSRCAAEDEFTSMTAALQHVGSALDGVGQALLYTGIKQFAKLTFYFSKVLFPAKSGRTCLMLPYPRSSSYDSSPENVYSTL